MKPYVFNSVSELHRRLGIPKPEHPLVSVIRFEDITCFTDESLRSVVYNFYCIAVKKNFEGKMKYGQHYYDFDEGVMTFFAPGQVITTEIVPDLKLSGWWLVVHPDFIQGRQLASRIKSYGYFSYAVNEALHLSEKEEEIIEISMKNIRNEYQSSMDHYSQDLILSHMDLLLNYCNRFYNRQFITRSQAVNDLLSKLEMLLTNYFSGDLAQENGLPTVQYLASELHYSPTYLSDMLRTLTGQGAQHHIQQTVIEKAKEYLTTTTLTISEIAYLLGFEHPQSFNKLFKRKTSLAPLEFRQSFN